MKLECTYFQFSYYTMGSLQCFIMEKPSKFCWNNIHSVAKSITSQIFQPLFVWNSSTSTTFSFLSNTLFKLIMPDREVRIFQNPVTSALVLLQSPYSQSVLICLLMWQLLAKKSGFCLVLILDIILCLRSTRRKIRVSSQESSGQGRTLFVTKNARRVMLELTFQSFLIKHSFPLVPMSPL